MKTITLRTPDRYDAWRTTGARSGADNKRLLARLDMGSFRLAGHQPLKIVFAERGQGLIQLFSAKKFYEKAMVTI